MKSENLVRDLSVDEIGSVSGGGIWDDSNDCAYGPSTSSDAFFDNANTGWGVPTAPAGGASAPSSTGGSSGATTGTTSNSTSSTTGNQTSGTVTVESYKTVAVVSCDADGDHPLVTVLRDGSVAVSCVSDDTNKN